MTAALLLVVVLVAAGLAGTGVLARLFRDEPDRQAAGEASVACGLLVGLVLAAFPGWLVTIVFAVPVRQVVLPLFFVTLLALIALTFDDLVELFLSEGWRARVLPPLAILASVFLFYVWLRYAPGEIRQTEKPMDFAVLNRLLTQPILPLSDPWFAGERFSYYHFGTYVYSLPIRVSGLASELAYNLLAAFLPGLLAAIGYGVIRLRGGGRAVAIFGALFLVFCGTFDGTRQILGDKKWGDIDIWISARRVKNCITEWPGFTFWLGDLHPHEIAAPLFVLLFGLAGRVASFGGVLLDAILLAALVSSNPWDLPGALLGIAAGNLTERGFGFSVTRGISTVALSVPFLVPFLTAPKPPSGGLRLVAASTGSVEAFLHFGAMLAIPALAIGIALARSRRREDEALLMSTLFPALGIALSIVSGKPVLGLAIGFVAAVAYLAFREERLTGALRYGFLLVAAGAVLVSVPEILAVKDSYGEDAHRMNTVFKCYSGGALFFLAGSALLLPLVLSTRHLRVPLRAALALVLLGSSFHLVNASYNRIRFPKEIPHGLDGLAWMTAETPGDRKAVEWLRKHAKPEDFIAETSGPPDNSAGAYSDRSRIGSSTGRPTLLGWANHQSVWRGSASDEEVRRRQQDLKTIFQSIELQKVVDTLGRRRIRWVVVGPLERKDFGEGAFPTRNEFPVAFAADGTTVYRIDVAPQVTPPPGQTPGKPNIQELQLDLNLNKEPAGLKPAPTNAPAIQ